MVDFNKDISSLLKSIGEMGAKMEVLQNKKNLKEVKNIQKKDADFGGVYVLWEKGKTIYVGLSKDVYGRIKNHRSANMSMSSFASHLIREQVANKGGGIEYMVSSFYNENRNGGKTKNELKEYMKSNSYEDIIKNEVRERIEKMSFTCVEENNDLKQFLLEVFSMKALKTITEEEEPRDNIDKKNLKYIKYNFTY